MKSFPSYGYVFYDKLPVTIGYSCFKNKSNVKFDVILVDGRVRPQCAYQALILLKVGGVLLIHDWENKADPRPAYRIALRWFELLHTEGRLAVFRVRPGKTALEHYANPGKLPSWWVKTQTNPVWWLPAPGGGKAYSEPFEDPRAPTAEELEPIQASWSEVKARIGYRSSDDNN